MAPKYEDEFFTEPVDPAWRKAIANNDHRPVLPLDIPQGQSSGDPSLDGRTEELTWQVRHAYNRGMISREEAENAITGNDHGFVAKAVEATFGIEATNDGVQTFVDILSMPNYAVASLAAARSDSIQAASAESGEVLPWYDPVRWNPFAFSTSDFTRHFQDRTYFGDVVGVEYDMGTKEGWAAIGMDIFLDPTTYLTFGMGAGAKVALKSGAAGVRNALGKTVTKGGMRLSDEVAEKGAELTLSRWGTSLQREAAKELWPTIEKEIAEEVAKGSKLSHIAKREQFLERSVEYMLDPANYHRLAKRTWKKDKRLTTRAQQAVGKYVGDDVVPNITRVFSESTPAHLKELGISGAAIGRTIPARYIGKAAGAGLRRTLEALPRDRWYGRFSYSMIKRFNGSWGLNDNQRAVYNVMRNTINSEQRKWTRTISDGFSHLTDEEAEAVTTLIERSEDVVDFTAKNAEPALEGTYAPHVHEAAELAKQIFADIAVEEQKFGILNETIDNYVAHIFNHDSRKIDAFMQMKKDKGWSSRGNPFSVHRQIASISELRGLFPEDTVLTNIGQILYRRKMMSVDLINKQKFYQEMIATSGWPAVLIAKAGESVPTAYAKRMMATRGSGIELSDIHQIWSHEGIDTAKWAFKEGDADQNMRVLDYLTTNRTERAADAGWLTDNLKNFAPTIKKVFKVPIKNAKVKVDAMRAINGLIKGDPMDKMSFDQLRQVLKKFDVQLRKHNVGPLLGVFPELEGLLLTTLRNPKKPPKAYTKLIDDLSLPVKGLKLAAEHSEDFILLAKSLRKRIGILTDDMPPSKQVVDSIMTMLGPGKKGFGFLPDEVKQLTKAMFNKSTVGSLTSAEADILETFLGIHFGKKSAIRNYMSLTGERMVKVDFRTPSGKIPSLVKTNLDETLKALIKSEDKLTSKTVKLDEGFVDLLNKEEALRASKNSLSSLRRAISDSVKARKGMKRGSTQWNKSIKESKSLQENLNTLTSKYGTTKDIDGKLKAINADRAKLKLKAKDVASGKNLLKARKKWAEAADEHMRNPTNKTKKALASAEKRVRELGGEDLEHGVKDYARKDRAFKPSDERLAGETVRAPKETIKVTPEGLSVGRDPGTFGAMLQQVGERPFAVEARSYYMPESIADLLKDINQTVYSKETNWLFRKYDAIQNMFKAPLMAVWPEFYKRNTVTNVALTYLKSGVAMLNPSHQKDFLRTLVYVLSKETIDIKNLPKTYPAFTATFGAGTGLVVGGAQHAQEEGMSVFNPLAYLSGEALTGAVAGAGAGAGVGVLAGVATKAGIESAARGGVGALAPHAITGAALGGMAAPEGEALTGAAIGAVAGGAWAKKALGEGFGNVDKIGKMLVSVGDKKFTIAEFAEEAAARGVFSTHVSEEIFKQSGAKALAMSERMNVAAPKGMAEALRPSQALFARDVFRAGELASEIPTRLMLFTIEAKRTGSLGEAARAVKDYLYDYSNLTMFERRVMRRIMPFYTWTKHALSTSVDSFYKQPGRVGHMFKFVNNQNKHIDADPADYPDWLSTRLKRVKVSYDVVTGEKKLDVKQGYGLVQEDTMDLWKQVFGGDVTKALGRGPFALTPLLEYAMDKDFFRGSHIKSKLYERSSFESGRAYENAPSWLKDAVGHTVDPETGYSKVDPRAAWLLSEIPSSRFINIARKVYDSPTSDLNWFSLARQVFGEKMYKYGPEQRLYYDKARLDRMAFMLKKINEVSVSKRVYPVRPSTRKRNYFGGSTYIAR